MVRDSPRSVRIAADDEGTQMAAFDGEVDSTDLGDPERLVDLVDAIAAHEALSGAIRIDREGHPSVQRAYGLAHRGLGVANTVDTRFAIASGTKGFTALTVMSLVEAGLLARDTTARSVLGSDLALIDDGVTVEHLLGHRSGIGDYLDEDEIVDGNDYTLSVPAQELAMTEQFLAVLDGHPTKFPPGERFSYSNGGYVVLALIAERAAGVPFHDLVDQRVCRPAGLVDTAFLRSDESLGRVALGYLDHEGMRTNVFHLPVRGNGDGGIYTTAADVRAFWDALFAGRIVSRDIVAEMTRPTGDVPEMSMQYGLGFWLPAPAGVVSLHGFDAGVGFVTVHDHERGVTYTVMCNQTRGAWPVGQRLAELLATR